MGLKIDHFDHQKWGVLKSWEIPWHHHGELKLSHGRSWLGYAWVIWGYPHAIRHLEMGFSHKQKGWFWAATHLDS